MPSAPVKTPQWVEDWAVTLSMFAIAFVVHAVINSHYLGGYTGALKDAPSGQIWHLANFLLFVAICSTGVIRKHWVTYAN